MRFNITKLVAVSTAILAGFFLSAGLVTAQDSSGKVNSYRVDAGLVKLTKVVPAEASLQATYEYSLKVMATKAVADIMINDEIPAGATYVKSDPAASVSGSKLGWKIARMAEGEEKTIRVTLRADREGELTGCATITALPVCCVGTFVGKPQLMITKTGPAQVLLNNDISYNIMVKNTGTSVAKNVKIVDKVPESLKHSSGKDSLVYEVGNLAPNQSREVPITFTTTRSGRVCNVAIAESTNTGSVRAEACTVVVRQALDIAKTGPQEQYLGKVAKYQIKVSNPGDVALTNVTVIDNAPSGTKIVSATGGMVDGDRAKWTIPQLKAGESETLSIALTTVIAGKHCNSVAVASAEGLSANSSACTLWKGYPALLLEVIDVIDPLQVGESTTYEIRVTNQGTAPDTNVGIVARFPSEITPKTANGSTTGRIDGKTVTFAPYPQLAPKEAIKFVIKADAIKIGDSRLKVEMSSNLLKTPVVEEESTHVY